MKYPSFWDTLQQPIIALAPMDGVTDAPNRTMHGLYGRPDVVLTEFTNVEGLWRGGDRIFRDFLYTPAERPVVAQIFGCRPEYFYKALRPNPLSKTSIHSTSNSCRSAISRISSRAFR